MASQTGARSGAAAPASEGEGGRTPVADRIRERIRKARGRFHANDNIAAYIQEGELEQLRLEVAGKIDQVLQALVIDTESDHNTQDTARRVAASTRTTTSPPTSRQAISTSCGSRSRAGSTRCCKRW